MRPVAASLAPLLFVSLLAVGAAERIVLQQSAGWDKAVQTMLVPGEELPVYRVDNVSEDTGVGAASSENRELEESVADVELSMIAASSLSDISERLQKLSSKPISTWAASELGLPQNVADSLEKHRVDGVEVLGLLKHHALHSYGSEASHWECNEQSSLGLPSYCLYHQAICIEKAEKYIIIDSTKAPFTPLPQYNIADKHPNAHMEIGQFLVARRGGPSQGTPFRSFLGGYYMPPSFLHENDVVWVDGFSFLPNRDDACSKNIFHIGATALVAWYYLLHEHNWGDQSFDWENSNCTVFDRIVTTCDEETMPQFARDYYHATVGSPECAPLWLAHDLHKQGSIVCFRDALIPGHDAALFHGPEDAYKFKRRMLNRISLPTPMLPLPTKVVY